MAVTDPAAAPRTPSPQPTVPTSAAGKSPSCRPSTPSAGWWTSCRAVRLSRPTPPSHGVICRRLSQTLVCSSKCRTRTPHAAFQHTPRPIVRSISLSHRDCALLLLSGTGVSLTILASASSARSSSGVAKTSTSCWTCSGRCQATASGSSISSRRSAHAHTRRAWPGLCREPRPTTAPLTLTTTSARAASFPRPPQASLRPPPPHGPPRGAPLLLRPRRRRRLGHARRRPRVGAVALPPASRPAAPTASTRSTANPRPAPPARELPAAAHR